MIWLIFSKDQIAVVYLIVVSMEAHYICLF